MVLCIVAAIVFGVLSIFSARYRPLAKEGFRCAFRMITFRKCDVQLEERLRAGVTGRLMARNPRLASFIYHNFKALSWIFVVVFFVSLGYSGYSIYNLAIWGTCEPGGVCIFVSEAPEEGCIQADAPVAAPEYFDAQAPVMFFYRDGCPWCQKQKAVLSVLATEGYSVKPMHLDSHPHYWEEYGIKVTPTFIGPDDKRLLGYHEYNDLKSFLDQYG